MRKFYLMAFPLIMAVFLVCGCSANQDADAMCDFSCDSVINLKIGTANVSDAVAYAPIETNALIQDLIIDYDRTIIDYDVATGRIDALRAGTTRIKCTLNDKTKYVQVNVVQSVYCSSLLCNNFVMELGKTADLLSANRKAVVANSDYNMGYTFESLDKNILSVDEAGVVTAYAVGKGKIQVVAKTSLNNDTNSYNTVCKEVEIEVMQIRSQISFDILKGDSIGSMTEVEFERDANDNKCYTLYSNTNYVLKISSDQILSNCFFAEMSTPESCDNFVLNSVNDRLVSLQNSVRYDTDPYTEYQPFRVVDCGTDVIQKSILDTGYNFYYVRTGELLKVRVYQQVTDSDLVTTVYNAERSAEYDLINDYGNYYLFDGKDGEADPVVFVDVQMNNEYCDNRYTFEADNVKVVKDDESRMLKVSCGESAGQGTLTIKTIDGGVIRVIKFYNHKIFTTITTTANSTTVLYYDDDGNAYFSADYKVKDEFGVEVKGCTLEIYVFDNSDNYVPVGGDVIRYRDTNYPSFVIQFTKVDGENSQHYQVGLHAVNTPYYSKVLDVYIYANDPNIL